MKINSMNPVFIIEPRSRLAQTYRRYLEMNGIKSRVFSGVLQAIDGMTHETPSLVIINIDSFHHEAPALLYAARKKTPIVGLTVHTVLPSFYNQFDGLFLQPITLQQLVRVVQQHSTVYDATGD